MHNKPSDKGTYTFIMEFLGTTSAAQVRAGSPDEAMKEWFTALGDNPYGLTSDTAANLRRAFDAHDSAVPMQGITNVWCKTIWAGEGQLALFHLIRTSVKLDPSDG